MLEPPAAKAAQVFHVTDRRRELVHVRLPPDVQLISGQATADRLDHVMLRTSAGEEIGAASLVRPEAPRGMRRAPAPRWVTDDQAASGSLDDVVAHLLLRLG